MEKQCCKGNHSPSHPVLPERTTNARSGVSAMSLTIFEPPCVGIQVDTTLGPGRLLYPIRDERWIVLIGTKGYTADITVEEAIDGTDDVAATVCNCNPRCADCAHQPAQEDID